MTRGEKVAWIWVWSAITLFALGLPLAVWRYWEPAVALLEAQICAGSNNAEDMAACEHVAANEHATTAARTVALRKLAEAADYRQQRDLAIQRLTTLIGLGTATAEDWNFRGLNYFWQRDYDKAAEDFRQATRMNDTVGLYWANLGDALSEAGKHYAAIDVYTTALANGADKAEVLGNRGWARHKLGLFDAAIADLDAALAKDAGHLGNLNDRGLTHYALRNYPAALADFETALGIDKQNVAILTNRAMVHAAVDDTAKAAADVDRALTLDGNYRPARLEKSWQLLWAGRPVESFAEVEKADRLGPPDLTSLEIRASALFSQGLLKEAVADAERAMAMDGKADWPYLLRAQARRNAEDFAGSIADATVVIERRPEDADALAERAMSLLFLTHTDQAFADIDRAIKAAPGLTYMLDTRSYMNMLLGRLEAAEADARRSLERAPQSIDSLIALGWSRLERHAPADALQYCAKALGIKETDFVLRCRAMAQLELKQLAAASVDAERALGLDKFNANNHYLLGRIALARGDASGAMAHFDHALTLRVHDRAVIHLYRGDAERLLGNIDNARRDYLEAKKRDLGQYTSPLAERLNMLPAPRSAGN